MGEGSQAGVHPKALHWKIFTHHIDDGYIDGAPQVLPNLYTIYHRPYTTYSGEDPVVLPSLVFYEGMSATHKLSRDDLLQVMILAV